jgi:topoisomerase IA-like protein
LNAQILDLPLKVPSNADANVSCYVELGRYGLYLKINGTNTALHPDLMIDAFNRTLTYEQIIANPAPQKVFTKNTVTKSKKYKKK